jgi:quercetin dioxygenase-like cupin family protein
MKRVVCGVASDGTSTVILSGEPHRIVAANGNVHLDVWATTAATPLDTEDFVSTPDLPLLPADTGGTRFRVSTFEPGSEGGMHHTETVDYGVVLSGQMLLTMGDGAAVELMPGDCVVQLGGVHRWRNPSDTPAVVAFVAIAVADKADINYQEG